MKILVTCPPMLRAIEKYRPLFEEHSIELHAPEVVQTLTEDELCDILPSCDGWIIGDDPATKRVFKAGKDGNLQAAVKWGIGVDNVDFDACKEFGIPITNTPGMFGREVADIAMGYVIGLARQTFKIDRGVRKGEWPKPAGISLKGKKVALIGFGDIGRNTAKRMIASEMDVHAVDPTFAQGEHGPVCTYDHDLEVQLQEDFSKVRVAELKKATDQADFIVVTCALTPDTRHMVNLDCFIAAAATPERMRSEENPNGGVRVINVARGPIIDEKDLIAAIQKGHVHSAALDVYEEEPLLPDNPLRRFENCVFGSHNGSHTEEGVDRTSMRAIEILFGYLGV